MPDESNSRSFDTVGTLQRISAVHMRSYLEAAEEALAIAINLNINPYQSREFDLLNNAHHAHNFPIFLACGGFKHGRYVTQDENNNMPLCNLFLTMLNIMGMESDRSVKVMAL